MIEHKWAAYGKTYVLRDAAYYVIYVVSFTIQALGFKGSTTTENQSERWGGLLALGVTAIFWLYFVRHEIYTGYVWNPETKGFGTKLKQLILVLLFGKSVWDKLQRLSLAAVAAATILNLNHDFSGSAEAAALGLPLLYFNLPHWALWHTSSCVF